MTDARTRVGARIRRGATPCLAMGALLGVIAGTLVATASLLEHGTPAPVDRDRAALLLALAAAFLAWLVLRAHKALSASGLFLLMLLALLISWMLMVVVIAMPALQSAGSLLGFLIGVLAGAVVCRLCRGWEARRATT